MESIGIVRKVDELGRIVIPKETREKLFIEQGDALEIFYDESAIYLKKYNPGCIFCNRVSDTKFFKRYNICEECSKILTDLTNENKSENEAE